MKIKNQLLQVFLCHASDDKPIIRDLYHRLISDGVNAWLDEEKLIPGQDWGLEIQKAVQSSDTVIICLSKNSITKEGYLQKEIRIALDLADEKIEGSIFIIPLKLEDCDVPTRLTKWQWVNLYEDSGYKKLISALSVKAYEKGLLSPIIRPSGKSSEADSLRYIEYGKIFDEHGASDFLILDMSDRSLADGPLWNYYEQLFLHSESEEMLGYVSVAMLKKGNDYILTQSQKRSEGEKSENPRTNRSFHQTRLTFLKQEFIEANLENNSPMLFSILQGTQTNGYRLHDYYSRNRKSLPRKSIGIDGIEGLIDLRQRPWNSAVKEDVLAIRLMSIAQALIINNNIIIILDQDKSLHEKLTYIQAVQQLVLYTLGITTFSSSPFISENVNLLFSHIYGAKERFYRQFDWINLQNELETDFLDKFIKENLSIQEVLRIYAVFYAERVIFINAEDIQLLERVVHKIPYDLIAQRWRQWDIEPELINRIFNLIQVKAKDKYGEKVIYLGNYVYSHPTTTDLDDVVSSMDLKSGEDFDNLVKYLQTSDIIRSSQIKGAPLLKQLITNQLPSASGSELYDIFSSDEGEITNMYDAFVNWDNGKWDFYELVLNKIFSDYQDQNRLSPKNHEIILKFMAIGLRKQSSELKNFVKKNEKLFNKISEFYEYIERTFGEEIPQKIIFYNLINSESDSTKAPKLVNNQISNSHQSKKKIVLMASGAIIISIIVLLILLWGR